MLRYLAAYGPASVKDMQKWSGLSRLGAVFTRLGERLRRYRDEHGTVLHDLAETGLPDADMDVPVRFLPEFDNILLSHAERERILPPEYRREVFTVNGIIRPTILVDGFVAGRWRIDRGKGPAVLTVEPFAPLPGTGSPDSPTRANAWSASPRPTPGATRSASRAEAAEGITALADGFPVTRQPAVRSVADPAPRLRARLARAVRPRDMTHSALGRGTRPRARWEREQWEWCRWGRKAGTAERRRAGRTRPVPARSDPRGAAAHMGRTGRTDPAP
ncbi:hypothetical protein GCM10009716_18420 [Streptomyces sodiiphilus]|uniref:Winged helix DNA-binding domain-containing protein n=1 Tax=Streptomyces sodiiphilus TaxID=226217 RepID=A0ABP5AAQ4_9ACTN